MSYANRITGLEGNGNTLSNLGLTGCYNVCGITHPFSREKREACRERCDKQFAAEQQQQEQQQEMLEQIISDSGGGGISTGAVIGIIAGIIVVTIGGVIIIRRFSKRKT